VALQRALVRRPLVKRRERENPERSRRYIAVVELAIALAELRERIEPVLMKEPPRLLVPPIHLLQSLQEREPVEHRLDPLGPEELALRRREKIVAPEKANVAGNAGVERERRRLNRERPEHRKLERIQVRERLADNQVQRRA